MKIIYPKPWGNWSPERKAWLMSHLEVLGITEDEVCEVESIHLASGKAKLRVGTTRGWIERDCVLPIPG